MFHESFKNVSSNMANSRYIPRVSIEFDAESKIQGLLSICTTWRQTIQGDQCDKKYKSLWQRITKN